MFYRLISSKETIGKVFVPRNFFRDAEASGKEYTTLSAGESRQRIEVVLDPELNKDELRISSDIIEELSVPTDIRYQIILERKTINIGPIIGLLMATGKESMTRVRLRKLLHYSVVYPTIQGLLLAFSAEDIDFENRLVKGYYYDPALRGKTMPWKEGVFPIPDSIFQRTNLSEEVRVRLKKETRNRLFNSNYFNKWEFWNMVSGAKPYLSCLPETRLYKSMEDIDFMLSRHDTVYIKPINGTLSRGLYRITRTDDGYGFQGNQGSEVIELNSKEEAESYIANIVGKRSYIVQQAISPLKVRDRHLDFRVIMQKDHSMVWSCTGIVGFIGNVGDICTNWGFTSTFEGILKKYFDLSQKEIFKKKQEIIAVCKKVCEMLDQRDENYGDLGFDVMIDKDLKIWILEANKRHYHTVPLWINDMQMYYEIKSKPIRYAAALTGFDVY
jgi:hypothetical protein